MSAPELNFDKSDWTPVKFGDVAFEPKESVKDARAEGIEHVVGLEHIDSEDIHLRRSDGIDTSTTFTKKFSTGDVLFGRRRAYLKKAAQAPFEGICSGDITVMRANEELLLPELLPFIVNNDKFFDWAVTHSAGGLSPRCKFKDLANYEFLLPPKKQQAEIAELLWAMEVVVEKEKAIFQSLENTKNVLQRTAFEKQKCSRVEIGEHAKVFSGGTPNRKKPEYWDGTIPWVKTAEVNYQLITDSEEKITDIGLKESATKMVKPGSVLVAMYGQGVTRGRVAMTGIPVSCNQACAVIEPSDDIEAEFIYFYLEFKYEELRALAHGANQQNLNLKMVKSFEMPFLDKKKQREIVGQLRVINENKGVVSGKIESSKSLQKSLINQVF